MPIICVSRGSYHCGKAIAQKVAQELDVGCLSRGDLLKASQDFQLHEFNLVRNLHDATAILERFPHGRQRYISYIRSALLNSLKEDNIVYHGLIGHILISGISHVLKVRVIADIDYRIQKEVKRKNISPEKARYILKNDDEERRKWGLFLYGADINDPSQYDLVINRRTLSIDEASQLVISAATAKGFQATPESRQKIEDMALAAKVSAALIDFPNANVTSRKGNVSILLKAPEDQHHNIGSRITQIGESIPGVTSLKLQFAPFY